MKIKNLAFFGIMASILSVGGAHAADTKATVIASQAYVDAHANNAGMHVDTTEQTNWDAAHAAAVTNATNINALTANNAALTKAEAIKNMIVDSEDGIADTVAAASDTMVPTEKAVRAAIKAAEDTASSDLSDLEERVSTNETNIETNTTAINTINGGATTEGSIAYAVKAEETRATTAETNLGTAISAEETRATGAEESLEAAIDAEVTRATTAEGSLDTDIKANATAIAKRTVTVDAGTDIATITDGTGTAYVYTTDNIDGKFDDIDDALNTKAGKATTLAGYDIGDAYTKTEVDTALNTKEDTANKAHITTDWNRHLQNEHVDDIYPTVAAVNKQINDVANTKATATTGMTASSALSVVQYTAQGVVNTGTPAGNLAIFQETGSTGVNNETLTQLDCSNNNPCILSYTGEDGGYKWTPMVFPTAN